MASRGINQPTVDQMGAKRRALLEVLYAKGTARTSELRRDADIPQGSKRYHLDRLRIDPSDDVDTWGYIKVVDRVPSEYGGSDERVWALTSSGEEYVEQTLSVDPTTREDGLTSRIEALERTVREQQKQINEFNERQSQAKEVADEARTTAESARMDSKQTSRDVRRRLGKLEDETDARIDRVVRKIAERIDELEQEINDQGKKDQIDRQFEQTDEKLGDLDSRITAVREEIEDDEPSGFFEEIEVKLQQKFGPYW